ncbi:MAG: UPF0175 family protein [Acidobacteria bacterium]|nr:UPF0175 family protein [Acidobacteriota bacterium]MCW5969312.1 UPF0175 family protein [Blastocatellales bacterium]
MSVTILLPDEVLADEGGDLQRQILELVALAGFKSGQLTTAQVCRILGLSSRLEAHEFLKEHGVPWVDDSVGEIEREIEELKRLAS